MTSPRIMSGPTNLMYNVTYYCVCVHTQVNLMGWNTAFRTVLFFITPMSVLYMYMYTTLLLIFKVLCRKVHVLQLSLQLSRTDQNGQWFPSPGPSAQYFHV